MAYLLVPDWRLRCLFSNEIWCLSAELIYIFASSQNELNLPSLFLPRPSIHPIQSGALCAVSRSVGLSVIEPFFQILTAESTRLI